MTKTYSYACREFPGMESCPGEFTVETREELVEIVESHARLAHGENPEEWSEEDRAGVAELIHEHN